ncbi:glucan biosynthesis protein D [Alcanivorax sp. S71-1-4]|uniref:glucan biosynthesis protein n=1 Tax=Alcanivorax sp. S71-1-4 TaxID=1177159 RepID=UPI00135862BD|nr:glucan biosynthesis protein G [Alcanivorax sp. S71-1-4]KAF0810741.1 glucan biosynthesis protein D [Alcanivorax sp. S71-1-4]
MIRHIMTGLLCCLLWTPQVWAEDMVRASNRNVDIGALFQRVEERARELAQEDFKPASTDMPDVLANMDYQQYRSIRFRPEQSLWHDQALFEVQLFHPGFLYREPVRINIVEENKVAVLPFERTRFRYDGKAAVLADEAPETLGYAGFRVHYPLNTEEYKDEFLVFQGASYFRLVGPGQAYGLSARGLAVDTAAPQGEEFPAFREFWLVRPRADETRLIIFALLDSPSVTGAYWFEVQPGAPTGMRVDARLFARKDIAKLGIAPLTSMFHHGENRTRFVDDFRPEVHDSDGLQMLTGQNEWIWRPLNNPRTLRVTAMMDENPRGFGLLQRDRRFDHYQDMEAAYERRPGLWVIPEGDWGKGRVELVEIPTDSEVNDNIVSYWVPEAPMKAGESRRYAYHLRSVDAQVAEHALGSVLRTRIGWGAVPGQSDPPPRSVRQFVVDFRGGELASLSPDAPLEAELAHAVGKVRDLHVQRLPDGKTWRAIFKLDPQDSDVVDMRLYLSLRGQRLTEVWSYLWSPDAVD